VVYPPVDTEFFKPDASVSRDSSGCLIVSALVPYKRVEIALDACRLAGVPLTVIGGGPDRPRLERLAAKSSGDVRFLGRLDDDQLRDQYRRAALVLMPGEEDFGIVPVEAQACGCPVVALGRGGAIETIVPGETGILVDEPTPPAFAAAIRGALAHRFDAVAIRHHAERFRRSRFGDQMTAIVDDAMREGGRRAW
jgi:glycosyltransferase involved in cell wall biosynthesis